MNVLLVIGVLLNCGLAFVVGTSGEYPGFLLATFLRVSRSGCPESCAGAESEKLKANSRGSEK